MNDLPMLQNSAGVRGLPDARSGVFLVRGKVAESDWSLADSIEAARGPACSGFGRLERAWARPGQALGGVTGNSRAAHAGWDYGIRAPEQGETAPCWEEVLSFLRLGAHEVDA